MIKTLYLTLRAMSSLLQSQCTVDHSEKRVWPMRNEKWSALVVCRLLKDKDKLAYNILLLIQVDLEPNQKTFWWWNDQVYLNRQSPLGSNTSRQQLKFLKYQKMGLSGVRDHPQQKRGHGISVSDHKLPKKNPWTLIDPLTNSDKSRLLAINSHNR